MRRITEYLISKILDRKFQFDRNIPLRYIFFLVFEKALSAVRGLFKLKKMAYIGRNVKVKCKSKLIVGSSVSINNNVVIDALSKYGISLGNNSKINSYTFILASGSLQSLGRGITIGNNVAIGEYSYLGGAGGLNIGDDTIIGQYFSAHPENHNYENRNVLIREQGVNRQGIKIGGNCWVGSKVTILDGVEIGSNCIVAAGAVVNTSFPDNVLIGGVPARILKCIK